MLMYNYPKVKLLIKKYLYVCVCIVVRLHHSPAQNPLLFLNIVVKGGDFFFLTFICLCQVLVEVCGLSCSTACGIIVLQPGSNLHPLLCKPNSLPGKFPSDDFASHPKKSQTPTKA